MERRRNSVGGTTAQLQSGCTWAPQFVCRAETLLRHPVDTFRTAVSFIEKLQLVFFVFFTLQNHLAERKNPHWFDTPDIHTVWTNSKWRTMNGHRLLFMSPPHPPSPRYSLSAAPVEACSRSGGKGGGAVRRRLHTAGTVLYVKRCSCSILFSTCVFLVFCVVLPFEPALPLRW